MVWIHYHLTHVTHPNLPVLFLHVLLLSISPSTNLTFRLYSNTCHAVNLKIMSLLCGFTHTVFYLDCPLSLLRRSYLKMSQWWSVDDLDSVGTECQFACYFPAEWVCTSYIILPILPKTCFCILLRWKIKANETVIYLWSWSKRRKYSEIGNFYLQL